MDQVETWHAGRPQSWSHCLDGDPARTPPKGHSPQFSAHIRCGQMAGWIKMPFGKEVGLGASDIVLAGVWGPRFHSRKRRKALQFSAHVYCGQTAGWIKMALGMEVGLDPGHIMLGGDPAPPPRKRGTHPNFRSMSIVAKRLDGSRCHLVRR